MVHPLGRLTVRQKVVPLGIQISLFGSAAAGRLGHVHDRRRGAERGCRVSRVTPCRTIRARPVLRDDRRREAVEGLL